MPSTGEEPASRQFNLVLAAIALLCLIAWLPFALHQFVEYDGYMHIWISQQDRWDLFMQEYRTDAHPVLYYILLRLMLWFGKTPLIYRTLSLLPGAASVYVLGKTAFRAMRSPVWAAVSALAYGLALATILTANEVRAYMLSAFLVQVSFYYFLDLIGEQQPKSIWPRGLFIVTAALACVIEYYAFFYAGAVLLLAFALPIFRRDKNLLFAELREATSALLLLALPIEEFLNHIGTHPVAFDHLPGYYFQPDAGESAVAFLMRNLRNEMNWFSPWKIPEGPLFYAALGTFAAACIAIVFMARKWRAPKNLAAVVSIVLPFVTLCAIMAASLVRAYPFGGFLRQQFIVFPFFAIVPFLLADRVLDAAPRTASLSTAVAVALWVTFVNYQSYQAWPKQSAFLLTDQMNRYNRMFPKAEAIYLDGFNLTSFFMHHHDWNWEFVGTLPGEVDVYRMTRDGRSMIVFRDRHYWILDLRAPLLYSTFAAGMQKWHLHSVTVFSLAQQPGRPRTTAQLTAYRDRIAELSAANGLCVQTLELENYDVYAEFDAGGCTPN